MSSNLPTGDKLTSDDIAEMERQDTSGKKGLVRIRSNVCIDQNAWGLVPGDVLKRYQLHYDGGLTSKQHDELMYYEPCLTCRKTEFERSKDGCDRLDCRTPKRF